MQPARTREHRLVFVLGLALLALTALDASVPVRAAGQTSPEIGRESWQNVPGVVKALAIGEGGAVADVGAGGGFFTVRLSKLVGPKGRVLAVDVDKNVTRDLKQRVENERLTNVEVIQGEESDPKLPEGELDAVLVVNAYHEMTAHQAMLEHIKRSLKPGGRLVLVEPNRPSQKGKTREELALDHLIEPDTVRQDLLEAGFEVINFKEQFAKQNNLRIEFLMVAQIRRNQESGIKSQGSEPESRIPIPESCYFSIVAFTSRLAVRLRLGTGSDDDATTSGLPFSSARSNVWLKRANEAGA